MFSLYSGARPYALNLHVPIKQVPLAALVLLYCRVHDNALKKQLCTQVHIHMPLTSLLHVYSGAHPYALYIPVPCPTELRSATVCP